MPARPVGLAMTEICMAVGCGARFVTEDLPLRSDLCPTCRHIEDTAIAVWRAEHFTKRPFPALLDDFEEFWTLYGAAMFRREWDRERAKHKYMAFVLSGAGYPKAGLMGTTPPEPRLRRRPLEDPFADEDHRADTEQRLIDHSEAVPR